MREYKFRGKRVDNGKWVYGSLVILAGIRYYIKDDSLKTLNPRSISTEGWADIRCFEVDPSTVGQYTGLKDKNGKEGYGSDILNTPVGRAVIRFGEYSSPSGIEKHIGFYIEFTDGNYADLYRKDIGYWMPLSEIIGNIHDNPELLKEVE